MRDARRAHEVGVVASKYVNVATETSSLMLAVGRRSTATELQVRRVPHGMGYRFRLHCKDLPSTPDIVCHDIGKSFYCLAASGTAMRSARVPLIMLLRCGEGRR